MSSRPSVFISYASQDREAARSIRDVLLAAGIEAWYDENELGGGDVWDQKIRKQIRECVYFMPVISANTEARVEGYFRREWRLAAERTLDMADDVAFLVPVVLDQTSQEHARVPEKFLASQWIKLPGGRATPALTAWCARITSNEPPPLPRSARAIPHPGPATPAGKVPAALPPFPPFPHHVEGQKVKFVADIAGWTAHTVIAAYKHSPKWMRAILLTWLVIMFFRSCSSEPTHKSPREVPHPASSPSTTSTLTPEQMQKAKAVMKTFTGANGVDDLVRKLSKEFGDEDTGAPALFLEGFTAPVGDRPATELANSVFAALYGSLALEQSSHIALDKDSAAAANAAAALKHARAQSARYLLAGVVSGQDDEKALTVTVTQVGNGAVYWTHSYAAEEAIPTDIAKDIRSHLPPLTAVP